jgi:hypothetical protein
MFLFWDISFYYFYLVVSMFEVRTMEVFGNHSSPKTLRLRLDVCIGGLGIVLG